MVDRNNRSGSIEKAHSSFLVLMFGFLLFFQNSYFFSNSIYNLGSICNYHNTILLMNKARCAELCVSAQKRKNEEKAHATPGC